MPKPFIAIVSMIRNEEDILADWIEAALRQSDLLIITLHRSSPESEAILRPWIKAYPDRLILRRKRTRSYSQERETHSMMLQAFSLGAAWVVPLDADEFIGRSRSLRYLLSTFPVDTLASLYWTPCIPAARRGWWIGPQPTTSCKTAVPRSLFPGIYNLGNHVFIPDRGPAPTRYLCDLYHFPVRNLRQIQSKLLLGTMALLRRRDQGGAYNHWKIHNKALARRNLRISWPILRHWGMVYPGPIPEEPCPNNHQLQSWGWTYSRSLP